MNYTFKHETPELGAIRVSFYLTSKAEVRFDEVWVEDRNLRYSIWIAQGKFKIRVVHSITEWKATSRDEAIDRQVIDYLNSPECHHMVKRTMQVEGSKLKRAVTKWSKSY